MRDEHGFTLIEMIVALAVVSLLVGIGAPATSRLVASMRTTSALSEITGALAVGRMEAIRRNAPVTVCPSTDGRTCRSDGDWRTGWIVFDDHSRTGRPASVAAIIRAEDGDTRGLDIRATAGRRHIRFQPDGWSSGTNVTIRLCDEARERYLGAVIVNNAGRVRSERGGPGRPCR
jgi:type IV fimbrial biogenesis protein FimT